jgi:presenilin-like A22 family membrane protease
LPSYEPAGQSTSGSILNSIILIIFTFAMTTIMLILVKFRKLLILKILMILSIGMGTFLSSYIIFNLIFDNVASSNIVFLFSTTLSLLGMLSFIFPSNNVYTIITSFILASLYGTSLSLFIKPPTVLVIPVFFGLYDIYTVFRGPLKSLINESQNNFNLNPMVVNIKNLNIGLGDLIFYSMIPSVALILSNLITAFVIIFVISIGINITVYFLRKFDLFPGLPIPVFLSIFTLLLII